MTEQIDLITGQPDYGDKPNITTFTRFTLPFAYQLEIADESDIGDLYYQTVDKNALDFTKRKKYFTRETANTLYARGQWLSMCDHWNQTAWGKAEITVTLRDRNFNIGMLPPRIVLFELPEIKANEQYSIMQTGFLYVDVYFRKEQAQPPQLDDLLVLNEFFRYFGIPYDFHATIFRNIFANVPIKPSGNETIASLDMLSCYFERWAALLEIPFKHKDQYYRFFPFDWANNARKWMYNQETEPSAEHWQIYADNRCYVWTVAFLDNGGKKLKSAFEPNVTKLKSRDYGHWVKLLNVDYPPFVSGCYAPPKITHKSVSEFERQWAEQRTYHRWEHDGSFYGFCYHAAAILAPPDLKIFGPANSYYYDTSLLLLYIRMSLYRFSSELSNIFPEPDQNHDQATIDKLRNLRYLFSHFTILYRFPMPSNQQQSMEMYEINRKYLEIDQFFDEIQQEVDNTHEFLETLESYRLGSSANSLSTYGIPLTTAGMIAALISMADLNVIECMRTGFACLPNYDLLFQVFIVTVISIPIYLKFRSINKKQGK